MLCEKCQETLPVAVVRTRVDEDKPVMPDMEMRDSVRVTIEVQITDTLSASRAVSQMQLKSMRDTERMLASDLSQQVARHLMISIRDDVERQIKRQLARTDTLRLV